jgi:hypothetical protein
MNVSHSLTQPIHQLIHQLLKITLQGTQSFFTLVSDQGSLRRQCLEITFGARVFSESFLLMQMYFGTNS